MKPLMAPFARAPSSVSTSARRAASRNGISSNAARLSIAETVAAPIPRFGVLITRRALIVSCGFSNRRR